MEKSVEYNEKFMKDAIENYKASLKTFKTEFDTKTKFDKHERDYSFQCNGHLWAGEGTRTLCYGDIGYKRETETEFDVQLLDDIKEQDLIDIANDDMLIVPFNIGASIEIKGKSIKYKIKNIRYEFNKETGLMDVTFNCITRDDLQKLKLIDYGVAWNLETRRMGKESCKLIKFTNECVVRPIVVGKYAVDGSFLYRNKGDKTEIIGYWKGAKLFVGIKSNDSDLAMIVDNTNIIFKHKESIAPYKVYKENIVK